MDIPRFVHPYTRWTFRLFPTLDNCDKATIDISLQVLIGMKFSFLLGKYLGIELLGHMVSAHLTL